MKFVAVEQTCGHMCLLSTYTYTYINYAYSMYILLHGNTYIYMIIYVDNIYVYMHFVINIYKYLSKPTFSDKPNLVPGDMLGVSRLVNDRSSGASLRVD
jgi:hypothetical protein